MKTRLALFAAVVVAGVGLARADEKGRPDPTQAAEQPKDAPKSVVEKPDPAQPTPQPAESLSERPKGRGQPAIASEAPQKGASQKGTVPDGSRTDSKTDRERMVGNWFIVNDDSLRQGELWIITEDSILMHAREDKFGPETVHHTHRLDASKNPKQIDITVSLIKGPTVGVIKGIYILDADELRLCLGKMGKDRPAAFPEKPKPGEVLVLQREGSGATPSAEKGGGSPTAKGAVPPAATDAAPPAAKGAGSPTPTEKPLAKTDQELMVGNWFIVNEDSQRQGEMWVINDDWILMHEKDGGANAVQYAHRLDASKDPKQIDITVSRVKGPTVGVIKGIYILEGNELRLCLGEIGKDRPAEFPEKPKPGEVLVLHRASSGATPPAPPTVKGVGAPTVKGGGSPTLKGAGSPAAKGAPSPAVDDAGSPAATDVVPRGAQDGEPTRKVFTPEEAIKQRPKEPVTVRFKVASVQDESRSPGTGFGVGFILLKDGGSFSVRIVPPAMYTIMRLDIEPAKHFTGKFVWVTGLVQPDPTGSSFHIKVDDLDKSQFAVLKE